jgi:hypothetical protein
MKKLFKDNNKTAMQFVPSIVREINDGESVFSFVSYCSEALYKKIKGVHAGSLQSLIRELAEDATGKDIDVGLDAEKGYPGTNTYETRVEVRVW